MAAKYCVCGGKTEYTVKIPTFCSNCGQPFNKAFATTTTPTITRSTPVVSKSTPSYASRPQPENETESDYYDKNHMQELAQELVASLSKDEVGIIVPRPEKHGLRVEDVLDPKKNVNVGHREAVVTELSPSE